jgi:type III secretion protein L
MWAGHRAPRGGLSEIMPETSQSARSHLPGSPGTCIVRSAQVEAWRDGFRFLEEAKATADRLGDAARKAYDTEYARGYAEGRAAGVAEAARLVGETRRGIDQYVGSIEGQIADLALDVVRRVLGQFEVGELVARAAEEAAVDFRRARFLKITAHPEIVDRVRPVFAGYNAPMVTIEADPSLAKTACIISSEMAVVDAGIEAQLGAIADALSRPRYGNAP